MSQKGFPSKKVLVTGATGFIGSHCVLRLLQVGYQVRGSVRGLENRVKVGPLWSLCPEAADRLELIEADLLAADDWPKAVEGCEFVLHVASPHVLEDVSMQELVEPAVEGTLNVLRACAVARVSKVVLTNSVHAIIHDGTKEVGSRVFTEQDWSVDSNALHPYVRSKIQAEKVAWEFLHSLPIDERFEMTVFCPGLVFGPLLLNRVGTSALLVKRLLGGRLPLVPKRCEPCVDVRDVAIAHCLALSIPSTSGQRIILSAGNHWFSDFATALFHQFEPHGFKISTVESQESVQIHKVDNGKMMALLQSEPIRSVKSVVDMAYSILNRGLITVIPS